jgi:dTDP-4-dehydrorhamnose reductase
MRILVTGAQGQVGFELRRTLVTLGEVVACDRQELNLAQPDQIRARIRELKPQLIVNSAAYTAVDKAETEPDLAEAINAIAPGVMAEECRKLNATLMHYSTDYVFDGAASRPYLENDAPSPQSVYGASKLRGEQAVRASGASHLIFRTSWVYGLRGKNFLLTIQRLAREREELAIVNDQIGAPTWSRNIAEATAQIVAWCNGSGQTLNEILQTVGGTYHLTNQGQTTWYDFANALLRMSEGREPRKLQRLRAITTAEYGLPAARPLYSVMDGSKLQAVFGVQLPAWEQALALALEC